MALHRIVRKEEAIGIRAKKFWSLEQSRYVAEEYSKELCHGTHGLVFQPYNEVFFIDETYKS